MRSRVNIWAGVVVVSLVVALAWWLGDASGVSPLVVALVLAAVWANLSPWKGATQPTMSWAAKLPLRVGIVLLGVRLSYGAITEVGVAGLTVVLVTVVTALLGGLLVGSKLGMSRPMTILMSVGFAICGQSAIAAAAPLSGADEDEIGYAVGMVALFGSIAIFLLPLLNQVIGLDSNGFGVLAGASVHDTSQVIASASVAGERAVESATIVKLTRVLFLGPLLVLIGYSNGRSGRKQPGITGFLPWYVVGFIAAVVLRSMELIPDPWLSTVQTMEALALTVAMAGVGGSIRLRKLATLGRKPLIAGTLLFSVILLASVTMTRLAGF